jgi:hypothetical protein
VKRTTISFENSIGALTPETFLRLLSMAVYLREIGCSATQEMRDTIGDRTIESVHFTKEETKTIRLAAMA